MNSDWIYIGADIERKNWSKIGKTTRGLDTRHTSSQNTGYFIYTAYNIVHGNVHQIETELLEYIESQPGIDRLKHFSTGSKSECFHVNPNDMISLVETFIERNYPSCITYETLFDGISRYQCDDNVFRMFNNNLASWQRQPPTSAPTSLGLSNKKYFSGNQVEREADLGDGHFVDFETGMQGYRDEDGNIEWKEWD
ncbi:hypothetical protein ACN2MB_004212 [Vibrio parahaemolyticus]|uniref:hypothetical protein n=1 Tax=Vibrio parahaemolyticus TaxID=670 RepID=UPI00111CEE59|nr:hypothetical protein [Vibrio parahaemolyticus]TOI91271.1 hypothetical protein CGI50_15915 [Vibrio parahaemolyticus]